MEQQQQQQQQQAVTATEAPSATSDVKQPIKNEDGASTSSSLVTKKPPSPKPRTKGLTLAQKADAVKKRGTASSVDSTKQPTPKKKEDPSPTTLKKEDPASSPAPLLEPPQIKKRKKAPPKPPASKQNNGAAAVVSHAQAPAPGLVQQSSKTLSVSSTENLSSQKAENNITESKIDGNTSYSFNFF